MRALLLETPVTVAVETARPVAQVAASPSQGEPAFPVSRGLVAPVTTE